MKVGLIIPWRPQPTRIAPFKKTLKWYSEHFPEIPTYLGDKPTEKFNVSGSRNMACLAAIEDGCDVLVVSDADVLVAPDLLKEAIEKAYKNDVAVLPFDCYVSPDISASELIVNDLLDVSEILKNAGYHPANMNHVSGVIVMASSVFKTLNGWDERFDGWGYEDNAFTQAHFGILGQKMIRIKGNLIGLIHEDRDDVSREANGDLFSRNYLDKSRDQLLEYVKGNMID